MFREPVKLEEWIALDAGLADVVDGDGAETPADGEADGDGLAQFSLTDDADAGGAAAHDGESSDANQADADADAGEPLFSTFGLLAAGLPVGPTPVDNLDPFAPEEFLLEDSGQADYSLSYDIISRYNFTDGNLNSGSPYLLLYPDGQPSGMRLFDGLGTDVMFASNYASLFTIVGEGAFANYVSSLSLTVDVTLGGGSFEYDMVITVTMDSSLRDVVDSLGGSASFVIRYTSSYGEYFDFPAITLQADIPAEVADPDAPDHTDHTDGEPPVGDDGPVFDSGLSGGEAPVFVGAGEYVDFLFSLGGREEEDLYPDYSNVLPDLEDLDFLLDADDLDPGVREAIEESLASLNRLRERIGELRDALDGLEDGQMDDQLLAELDELLHYAGQKARQLEFGLYNLAASANAFLQTEASLRDQVMADNLESLGDGAALLAGQAGVLSASLGYLSGAVGAAEEGVPIANADLFTGAFGDVTLETLSLWADTLSRKDPYTTETKIHEGTVGAVATDAGVGGRGGEGGEGAPAAPAGSGAPMSGGQAVRLIDSMR